MDYQKVFKEELAKYLNMDLNKLNEFIEKNPTRAIEDWFKYGLENFYNETDVYLFGLVEYSNQERIEGVTFPIRNLKDKEILDFGAGIASMSIPLATKNKVYYYDLPSKTQDFAKHLVNKLKSNVEFLDETEVYNKKYDIVLCVDVLEHLKFPMDYLKKLTKCLKYDGILLTTGFSFSIGSQTPMHLEENVQYADVYRNYIAEKFKPFYFYIGEREIIYGYKKKVRK